MIAVFEYPGFIVTYENVSTAVCTTPTGTGSSSTGPMGRSSSTGAGSRSSPRRCARRDDQAGCRAKRNAFAVEESHLDHVRNFLDCIKSRQWPISDVEIGHRSTTAPHLANIALRSGRKVKWDGAKEQIMGIRRRVGC